MGGKYGTCFDISVLQGRRHLPDVALLAAQAERGAGREQGRHPLERAAQIVLGPRKETGWEDDINRPVVLKKGDTYHHVVHRPGRKGHSWIGYATSPDGVTWKRMSDKPVCQPINRGKRNCRDVSARDLGRHGEALPHVVLRRRTKRAERHRLRHQPGRADLEETSRATRSSAPNRRIRGRSTR